MRVDYYLNGHPDVIFDKVRMDADTFIEFSRLLEGRGLLHSTRNMSVDTQLFIFLAIVGHNYTIRDSTDHWQRSNETIGQCFKNVFEAIYSLKDQFIPPPDYNCNTSFTHSNSKLVNKMLFIFQNLFTKFLCNFFFFNKLLLLSKNSFLYLVV